MKLWLYSLLCLLLLTLYGCKEKEPKTSQFKQSEYYKTFGDGGTYYRDEFIRAGRKAEAGDAAAQFAVGASYAKGDGIPADAVKAVVWFEKSAIQGNADSQHALGLFYQNGFGGLPVDGGKAAEFFYKAAMQDHKKAQDALFMMFKDATVDKEWYAKAAEWYKKAAEEIQNSAMKGNSYSQFLLSYSYQSHPFGIGEAKDDAKTAQWLEKSAFQGNASAQAGKIIKDCPDCPEMVVIPAGGFMMGSSHGESEEKPVHKVSLKSFALGQTEVTQGQWRAIMGSNPSSNKACGDNCPVEMVSWKDIQEFVHKLSDNTGRQYRLPSEAQWEYACRAGKKQEYCGSDDVGSVAWYGANSTSAKKTNPVATKQANAFGLYDMSGNVMEWVEDSYHDTYNGAPADGSVWVGDGERRVLRGGDWLSDPEYARAANRYRLAPTAADLHLGFRLARILQ